MEMNKLTKPLSAHYSTEMKNQLSIEKFVRLEMLLTVLNRVDSAANPKKAYLILSGYNLIVKKDFSYNDFLLQKARAVLKLYKSKKRFADDLEKYQSVNFDGVRLYEIKDESFTRKTNDNFIFSDRESKYIEYLEEYTSQSKKLPIAKNNDFIYNANNQYVKVRLDEYDFADTIKYLSKKGGNIVVTIDELLAAAKEIDKLSEDKHHYQVLNDNVIKQIVNNELTNCTSLEINEVVNMIGMVGTGKSLLIKVLSYLLVKKGYRTAIIVDTVFETIKLSKFYVNLNIKAVPVIGRSNRLNHIKKIIDDKGFYPGEYESKILTLVCILDGINHTDGNYVSYGEEPCFSLKSENKKLMCPFYSICPATLNERESFSTNIVVTTVAGLVHTKVGDRRESFFEQVLNNFDLIIFDEADRVQKNLDQIFSPSATFDEFIKQNSNLYKNYMDKSTNERMNETNYHYIENTGRGPIIARSLQQFISTKQFGKWNTLMKNNFSALTLLENKESHSFPEKLYNELYKLIDDEGNSDLALAMMASENDDNNSYYAIEINRWLTNSEISLDKTQLSQLKLLLRLINFDHYLRDLSDYANSENAEGSIDDNDLMQFIRTRFGTIQNYIPSSVLGNLFGIKLDDKNQMTLVRQYAYGRTLMTKFPYLILDKAGKAQGPHVFMLSGSSWAKGSYDYHVSDEVNYIIESESWKRDKIAETKFVFCGLETRVSGSGNSDFRRENLNKVIKDSISYVKHELEHNNNSRLLMIVNSYEEATAARDIYKSLLTNIEIVSLAKDDDQVYDESKLKRGDVYKFSDSDARILVAPASAIERGHNIVDEEGHSAITSVFFLVRPMPVPDSLEHQIVKLNGNTAASLNSYNDLNDYELSEKIRADAFKFWQEINKNKSRNIENLKDNLKNDLVATLFIVILQIFGRLARITDKTKPAPSIYFVDGAFKAKNGEHNGFDLLIELRNYLGKLMNDSETNKIAKTLYEPFYQAYTKGENL